jgi:hypothetical protein
MKLSVLIKGERKMFELTEETRVIIIEMLRERLDIQDKTDDEINAIVDEIVVAVKKQFGF